VKKVEFLTIYATYENIEVVKNVLPSIIKETRRSNSALIVHDCSEQGDGEKWSYLRDLNKHSNFFLILSSNMSMAQSRNMALSFGLDNYMPDYVCMLEDDHGFREGAIDALTQAMEEFYGKEAPSGLLYGMFTLCHKHTHAKVDRDADGNLYPTIENEPFMIGGYNSCFRCAPTSHWMNVLKGYDSDGYLISEYQTANLRWRNYNKGFTFMLVGDGSLSFDIKAEGRGLSSEGTLKLWDSNYSFKDLRSEYVGKK